MKNNEKILENKKYSDQYICRNSGKNVFVEIPKF